MSNIQISSVPFDPEKPVNYNVGQCFISGNRLHFYMQREKDVLHTNIAKPVINILYVNHLTDENDIREISREKFDEALRNSLVNLDIAEYLKPV